MTLYWASEILGFACVCVILNEASDQFGESFGEPTGIHYICDSLQSSITFLVCWVICFSDEKWEALVKRVTDGHTNGTYQGFLLKPVVFDLRDPEFEGGVLLTL